MQKVPKIRMMWELMEHAEQNNTVKNNVMKKTLRLLMLLSGNRRYTINEIAENYGVTERTAYRYINEIEESGFIVDRSKDGYQLLKSDYNTKSIKKLIHFSEEEAYTLYRALVELNVYSNDSKKLITKLHTLYDFQALKTYAKEDDMTKLKMLTDAISNKKQVVLRNYHSSNSRKVEDRHVEPFEMMADYNAIWCYDLRDEKVKQFKISRVEEVDLKVTTWQNQDHHKLPFTDAFRMSAPNPITQVEATLSLKAYNLLKEEFPAAMCCVKNEGRNYQLSILIADYHGIGRFVLGLIDEIKIHSPQQFKDFLNEKIKNKF